MVAALNMLLFHCTKVMVAIFLLTSATTAAGTFQIRKYFDNTWYFMCYECIRATTQCAGNTIDDARYDMFQPNGGPAFSILLP